LIIPPWINKYYILDLSPKKSMVKWLVDNEIPVFMISWINPGKKLHNKSFDDYLLQGPIAAMQFIETNFGIKTVNTLGYCIGGLLNFILMSYLQYHKQEHKIGSATLMTTLLDYSDAGEIGLFLNEEQIEKIEQVMSEQKFFDGKLMGMAFSLLRSNDMIWSVIVNNYLLGKKPLPFEILYWNADSTRLTPKLHSYYLRNMYLNNNLLKPNKLTIADTPIDIFSVTTPCYFISALEDHIAPWRGTYRTSHKLKAPTKFVLTASGHVFGMINPPYKNKYNYWTNTNMNLSPSSWLNSATKHQGSWWNDWIQFLQERSGPKSNPIDSNKIKSLSLYKAPGKYVRVK
jgi:polyhydroxyalkanoate synthase subunit PhaC